MPSVLDLHYELPAELIAQHPCARRSESRLMVLDAGGEGPRTVGGFAETLLAQLRDDDLVVANDTRVLHARVRAQRVSGGAVELLLLEPDPDSGGDVWRAMARPARRLKVGERVACARDAAHEIELVERDPDGLWRVRIPVVERDASRWLEQVGEVPLPPYIEPDGQPDERYQTVYAAAPGSVAAPTAGLHFDDALWNAIRARCEVQTVTLHVGAGTFLPVRGTIGEHVMHEERYEVAPAADAAIRRALGQERRVVAVGTTTTRVLESVYGESSLPTSGRTSLFVTPGYRFGCVGALLTNFHLPDSTLLALVMAFAGVDATRAAYADAIARRMRFYSFGDAMFVHGVSA